MGDINIIETIPDDKSWFNIKRFKIGSFSSEGLSKSFDASNISKKIFQQKIEPLRQVPLIQNSKTIQSFETIIKITKEESAQKIKSHFGYSTWSSDLPQFTTLTLQFNPYEHLKKIEEMSGYLNYVYQFSKSIICIPNILKSKAVYINGKKESSDKMIIDLENYLHFVDETYQFFSARNNKPIFVPISLKFNIEDIKKIIAYYLKKEYYYFWIDFEAKPIGPIFEAKIREINSFLHQSGHFDRCVLITSNIKREIISHLKEDHSPSSDVLGFMVGSNIVGVSKDPKKAFTISPQGITKQQIIKHKLRKFNEETYYYDVSHSSSIPDKKLNEIENTLKLSGEFTNQRVHFLTNFKLQEYLKQKKMLNEYQNGSLFNMFNRTSKKIDINDFF